MIHPTQLFNLREKNGLSVHSKKMVSGALKFTHDDFHTDEYYCSGAEALENHVTCPKLSYFVLVSIVDNVISQHIMLY